ncbi:MAG: PilZ domain-containing protein [Deltaproteobacteria bacterium]|nr:PilZ domain-containing protein [Deltaproteobacteria bacterium]
MTTNRVSWRRLGDPEKILRILDLVISEDEPVRVIISGENEKFSSRILQVNYVPGNGDTRKGGELIIDKLSPEHGNYLVQSKPEIRLQFAIHENLCRCATKFLGTSSDYPLVGLILGFPTFMEINERRRDERYVYEVPEMVSVEIPLRDEKERLRLYHLNVCDCSTHGLGVLVKKKDLGVLEYLSPGDQIKDMTFYAVSAKITVNGIVRHRTPIKRGRYRGCYILGIESQDIIESCKPSP